MRGMGYRYRYIYSVAGQPWPSEEIGDWCAACAAAYELRDARIGSAGYRDMLLYGTMFDGMSLRRVVGTEIEPFELLEVVQEAEKIPDETVAEAVSFVRATFEF